jgi:hypothetical protein
MALKRQHFSIVPCPEQDAFGVRRIKLWGQASVPIHTPENPKRRLGVLAVSGDFPFRSSLQRPPTIASDLLRSELGRNSVLSFQNQA